MVRATEPHLVVPKFEGTKRTADVVGAFLSSLPSAALYKDVPEVHGAPRVIIVTSGAVRAVDLIRGLADYGKVCKVAKVFAKHMKVTMQEEYLTKHSVVVAVGTPARIAKLAEMGCLKLSNLDLLLVDSFENEKKQTIFDVKDTHADLAELYKKHVHSRVMSGDARLCLF